MKTLAIFAVLLLAVATSPAQQTDETIPLRNRDWIGSVRAATVASSFKATDGTSLPYRLFRPAAAATHGAAPRLPMILCLHAAGGRGSDSVGNLRGSQAFLFFAQKAVQADFPCILVAPQCPDGRRWVATPWKNGSYSTDALAMTPELACVDELVDWLCKTEPVDTNRLYLAGQSMGGFGAFDLLVRRPGKFAACVVSCGAGDPSKAPILKQTPLWFFHGEDDTTVPFAAAVELDAALRKAGGRQHRFTAVPGVGHKVYEDTFETDGVADWLFAQRKTPTIDSDGTGEENAVATPGGYSTR